MPVLNVQVIGSSRHPKFKWSKEEADRIVVDGLNRIISPAANVEYRLWQSGRPVHHRIVWEVVYLGKNSRGKHEHAAGYAWYNSIHVRLHSGWIPRNQGNNHPPDGSGYWHPSYWFAGANAEKTLQIVAAHEVCHNYNARHVDRSGCLMNQNANGSRICSPLDGILIRKFGKREPEPELPFPVGTKLQRLNLLDTNRGSAVLEDGTREHFNGMAVQIVGDMKVVRIGPAEQRKEDGREAPKREVAPPSTSGEPADDCRLSVAEV